MDTTNLSGYDRKTVPTSPTPPPGKQDPTILRWKR
jgi:hypothetical protein